MRVLQVLQALHAGGAEGFVTNLAVSHAESGLDVRVFLLGGARHNRGQTLLGRLERAGVEVVGAEVRKPASLGNLLALSRLIRSWKPDIVQANIFSSEVASVAASAVSLRRRGCLVRRLAGTELVEGYNSRRLARAIDRFFGFRIACSPTVATAYRDLMNGHASSRVETVVNGAHLLEEMPGSEQRTEARQALGLPVDQFVVTHIGGMLGNRNNPNAGLLSAAKAQDILLKAFAGAYRGDSGCSLVCVGDGHLRPEVEGLAKRLGVASQTHFLGEQPEPWQALTAADVFCFPSRREGLPNALVEAASCGLPVVASSIPEIRNLSPGKAWLLTPVDDVSRFADSLRTVRAEQEIYARHAKKAAQGFRERFSMKTCAEEYLRVYEMALGWNHKKAA